MKRKLVLSLYIPNNKGNEEERKERELVLADLKFCPVLYLTKIWTVLFHSKMTFQQKSVKQILVNSAFKSMCKVPKKIKIWQLWGEVLRLHHLPPPHPRHHLLLHQQHLISHHPTLTLMVTTFGIDPMYVIVTLKLETSIWYEIWLKICTQQVAFKILCC